MALLLNLLIHRSSKKFGVLNVFKELNQYDEDKKSYDPVEGETLCILLDGHSDIVLRHVESLDSVLKRVDLGLSRSVPSLFVASASLFREHYRFLFILDQLVIDAVSLVGLNHE